MLKVQSIIEKELELEKNSCENKNAVCDLILVINKVIQKKDIINMEKTA